jgi:Cu+-exporting ATPase
VQRLNATLLKPIIRRLDVWPPKFPFPVYELQQVLVSNPQEIKELLMAIDPVCGMEVDERSAEDKSTYQGQTYYFCSSDCREEFDSSPDEYIGPELATGT